MSVKRDHDKMEDGDVFVDRDGTLVMYRANNNGYIDLNMFVKTGKQIMPQTGHFAGYDVEFNMFEVLKRVEKRIRSKDK